MADREAAFPALIKRVRKQRGWTQQDLADMSDIGVRTLIRWENGEVTEPEARQVMAAADALGIDRTDLFRALGWIPAEGDEPDPVTEELLELRQAVASVLHLVDEQLQRQQNHQRQE